MCVRVFVSARSISASPFSVASVASVFVSIQLLISVSAAVPVMMFMINVASITLVISGRRPAAASVWGIAPQAPPCGGVSGSGLASAALQAGGAQRVEEEAFVGASQRTFQPSCRAHGLCSHAGSVSLPKELLHCTLFQLIIFCHRDHTQT